MSSPLDWLADFRSRLRLEARLLRMDPRVRRRFDSSDLVQKTMLKAHEKLDGFRGTTRAELICWLREILHNEVRDIHRREHAQVRDVAREQSLNAALAESSARLDSVLARADPSPGQQCEQQEYLLRLTTLLDTALEQLPEGQRDVVILIKLQGLSVPEIAQQMECTEKAIRDRLHRGLWRLREMPELRTLFEERP
jgi:RNA polymerase sigma-70 factor (ECF subfamily)